MRLFLFILITGLFAFHPFSASAEDMLEKFRVDVNNSKARLLFPGSLKSPETVAEYANMVYDGCVFSNKDDFLKEYVEVQCACTAAEISGFMTLQDMTTLFSGTGLSEFQYGRMLLLGYIPCMKTSVRNFSYDTCLLDPEFRAAMKYPRKTCACIAEEMGNFAGTRGSNLVPGFYRNGFRISESVANPLLHVVTGDSYERQRKYVTDVCTAKEARM